MLHEGDGGRYLGTWDLVISKDVDSGWVNWGMYRFMVYDAHHLTGFPRPTSHLGKVFQEHYVAKGKPMPLAIAIGTDPLSHFAAAATYALGGDEAGLAGGLRGRPVEMIRCETSDLLVPAHSEIVIEGEVLPDRVGLEGPYGEYPGYRTGEMGNGILFRTTAITHREKPGADGGRHRLQGRQLHGDGAVRRLGHQAAAGAPRGACRYGTCTCRRRAPCTWRS